MTGINPRPVPSGQALPSASSSPAKESGVKKVGQPTVEKPEKISVLLVAVPKEVISKYQRIVREVGLTLKSLESESFSLVRSLIGNDLSPTVLIDFGSRSTTLTIVDQGFVKMSHSVDLSGKEITRVISRGINISTARAEEFKKSSGMASNGAERGITQLVTPLIGRLVTEFEKMSTSYLRKEGVKIQKVILSGGAANLPGLLSHLSEKLLPQSSIGDPFVRVAYPPQLEKVLKQELSATLAVAVGLAKRDF